MHKNFIYLDVFTLSPYTMKCIFTLVLLFSIHAAAVAQNDSWIELFSGTNLDGWKISENPGSFSIEDKLLKVSGPRGHAFYVG